MEHTWSASKKIRHVMENMEDRCSEHTPRPIALQLSLVYYAAAMHVLLYTEPE